MIDDLETKARYWINKNSNNLKMAENSPEFKIHSQSIDAFYKGLYPMATRLAKKSYNMNKSKVVLNVGRVK